MLLKIYGSKRAEVNSRAWSFLERLHRKAENAGGELIEFLSKSSSFPRSCIFANTIRNALIEVSPFRKGTIAFTLAHHEGDNTFFSIGKVEICVIL